MTCYITHDAKTLTSSRNANYTGMRCHHDNAHKKYCSNWELLKFEVGIFFRRYCSEFAKKRKAEEDNIYLKYLLYYLKE